MSITKAYINKPFLTEYEDLASMIDTAIESIGLSAVITPSEEPYPSISIAVNELTIGLNSLSANGGFSVTATNKNGDYTDALFSNRDQRVSINNVYACSSGIVIEVFYSSQRNILFFTKTNTGKLALIYSLASFGQSANTDNVRGGTHKFISPDDSTNSLYLKSPFDSSAYTQQTMAVLIPVPGLPSPGSELYTPNLFIAYQSPFISYNTNNDFKDYILGSNHYLTNGYYWFKDDPV